MMIHPIGSLASRSCAVLSLGAFVASCSTGSSLAPRGSSTNLSMPNTADAARNAALSSGMRVAPHAGTQLQGWIAPDVTRRPATLFYWGNYNSSTITIYSSTGTQKGQITTGLSNPERLFADKSLNVYASNAGNSTITTYRRGATSPFLTISNGVSTPTGLTVDSASTVYVANIGNDTITEYPKGQTSPSLTISMGSLIPEYLSVDAADNLYVSFVGSSKKGVMEFPPGKTTGKDLGLNIGEPAGLALDNAGNIIVIDFVASTIDVFPKGQTQPSKKVSVTSGLPFALTFSKSQTKVYVTVLAGSAYIVQQLVYPGGTSLTNKLTTNAGQWPITVSPDTVL